MSQAVKGFRVERFNTGAYQLQFRTRRRTRPLFRREAHLYHLASSLIDALIECDEARAIDVQKPLQTAFLRETSARLRAFAEPFPGDDVGYIGDLGRETEDLVILFTGLPEEQFRLRRSQVLLVLARLLDAIEPD